MRLQRILAVGTMSLMLLGLRAQEIPMGAPELPMLQQLLQNVEYAQVLRTARFSMTQLEALHRIQGAYLDAATVTPLVEDAFRGIAVRVGSGTQPDEAYAGLGELQQEVQGAQQRLQGTEMALIEELQQILTDEQRQALLMHHSPVRGLQQVVDAVTRMRQMPDAAWQQFRGHAAQMMAGMAAHGGGAPAAKDDMLGWLDTAHKMTDEEFAKEAPGLAVAWAGALLPDMMKQLQNPAIQKQRSTEVCRQLINHSAGYDIVEGVIDMRREKEDAPPPAP